MHVHVYIIFIYQTCCAQMRAGEKHSGGLSPHEMAMERKEEREDEAQNEGSTSSVMVTDRQVRGPMLNRWIMLNRWTHVESMDLG